MISARSRDQGATIVAGAAASLLLADLFLSWQRVGMRMGGLFDVRTSSSGWSGWGAVAGICAIAVLVLVIARGPAGAIAAVALGALLFTAIAVLAGHAHVDVGTSMMRIQVDTTLWPAWVGLALAGLMAAAAAIPYLVRPRERGPATLAPRGGS